MEIINFKLYDSLYKKAENFSDFRERCKKYLTEADKNWDKFTIVKHDSIIGYLTEYAFSKALESKFPDIKISSWEDQFDMRSIIEIIDNNVHSQENHELIVKYFYDKWDLRLERNEQVLFCDVKTALTIKEPSKKWNFLYPVVQANKSGKDLAVLVYYIVGDLKDLRSFKQLILVGFTDYDKIKDCKEIKAGEKTIFGTISQIDNYITELGRDYSLDFDKLLKN